MLLQNCDFYSYSLFSGINSNVYLSKGNPCENGQIPAMLPETNSQVVTEFNGSKAETEILGC